MSKVDKYKFETGGWCDSGDDWYDPGCRSLELWQADPERSGYWNLVWKSTDVDGDDLDGTDIIKAELLEVLPKFNLTPEDIQNFDSDCIYDWEIR